MTRHVLIPIHMQILSSLMTKLLRFFGLVMIVSKLLTAFQICAIANFTCKKFYCKVVACERFFLEVIARQLMKRKTVESI